MRTKHTAIKSTEGTAEQRPLVSTPGDQPLLQKTADDNAMQIDAAEDKDPDEMIAPVFPADVCIDIYCYNL